MLTPRFEISQSEKDVTIVIYAPYTNIKNTQVIIDGDEFKFFSSPYYLRLHLPGSMKENDEENDEKNFESLGKYETDSGKFIFKVEKLNQGEYFKDLDYITTLLSPKDNKLKLNNSKIEELDEDDVSASEEVEEEFDWFYEQKLPEPDTDPLNLLNVVKYGFANQHSGVFKNVQDFYKEVIDIPNPDEIAASERNNLRMKKELAEFQEDTYLYDLLESEEIEGILNIEHFWIDKLKDDFTMEEIDVLKELPNKKFILESAELQSTYINLVDVLFAWCYDKRTTEGESTCVSSWTINKLSSTFSCLQNFYSLYDVANACIRRSLCYPLHRHYEISCLVLKDVSKILELGKKSVIKCLIEIYHMFNNSEEPRYILNELFVKDMIVWAQRSRTSELLSLSKALTEYLPLKKDLGLCLIEIETKAHKIIADREKDLIYKINNMKINDSSSSSSSSEYTSESSSELDSDDEEEEEEEEEIKEKNISS